MIELAPHHKRGLTLASPVLNASGILGFSDEYRGLVDLSALGAFVTNAFTWRPRTPAHPPNVTPLPNGVAIHTGLPNPGVKAAVRRYPRHWARLGPPVIVHLAATAPPDVARATDLLERSDAISGIELGLRDDVAAAEMAQLIRAAWGGPPLLVRLPLLRAAELCEAAAHAGADALTIGAPPRHPLPVLRSLQNGEGAGGGVGRLYSPDVFPIALEMLRAVTDKNLGLPLIGAGGIFSIDNARAMLEAGAVAVQVDAWAWQDPGCWSALAAL